ncbi:MAG TPA: pitrilysin family protein [Alphaproteobacteria bacterium]|nr:pitrilysin family protein [Alphaproteobacteria bacterium]
MLKRTILLGLFLTFAATAHAAVFYPTSFTLANGLQIVVVPNHLAPAVNQMVWYKVGSADETPGETGLAHYLEHLMFRGTSNMAPGDFSKIIAAQGGNDNAFTSYDYTAFHETVAADRLPMIMQMEADRMQNLQIMPETATPELSVVLDERQQRTDNDPQGRFNEKVRHLLMPHYPYGVPVIGWKPEIEKLTAVLADAFYHRHYAPNNAVVIISGDVTPEHVMELATAIYGSIPRRDVPARKTFPALPEPKRNNFEMVDVGVEQPQMEFNVVVPSYSTQQGNEAYAYEVLAEVLDGGEVGVLYRHLAVEQKLAGGTQTSYDPDARGPALFTIALTPRPGISPKKLEKALHDELEGLASKSLDPNEIKSAKERLQRAAIFARDNLMAPGYSFGSALTTGHGVTDVEEWPDRINAVSDDDVNKALRDYVASTHSIMASLLPDAHATAAQREAAHSLIDHDRGIR